MGNDQPMERIPLARVGDTWAWDLVETSDSLDALESEGFWVVALPFEGAPTLARFAKTASHPPEGAVGAWQGVSPEAWQSSLDSARYRERVTEIRERIALGDVYQVNLCRVLSARFPDDSDVAALDAILRAGNPAPHGGFLRIPGFELVSASPELFISRDQNTVRSGPIKGTAHAGEELLDKDFAENVMITDLVRNDLSRVATSGGVSVPEFLVREEHPGIAHLVSYVQADLQPGITWQSLLNATFPPGSVTGAPKYSALKIIDDLETESRGSYCGAFGWISGDQGSLGVTIRTFWRQGEALKFGTGAGITWLSDPQAEWEETELKARRLCALAEGVHHP